MRMPSAAAVPFAISGAIWRVVPWLVMPNVLFAEDCEVLMMTMPSALLFAMLRL